MIKAIFFDIDGTLLSFDTHAMSPAVLDALHQLRAQGVRLFISTGRHKSMIGPVRDLFPFDGYITLNGQYCFCGDQVLRREPLDKEDVAQLVELSGQGILPCMFLEEEDTYITQLDPRMDVFPVHMNIPLPPLADPSRALEADIFQTVVFLSREQEPMLLARTKNLNPARWHPDFIDGIAYGSGKDKGMDAILAHFNIPLEETMAFGDGENDLPMLRHAGIGVAMGNAGDLVKAEADYITDSVDEDGIVTALHHFGILPPVS